VAQRFEVLDKGFVYRRPDVAFRQPLEACSERVHDSLEACCFLCTDAIALDSFLFGELAAVLHLLAHTLPLHRGIAEDVDGLRYAADLVGPGDKWNMFAVVTGSEFPHVVTDRCQRHHSTRPHEPQAGKEEPDRGDAAG
jgi:hypothetical protein